MVGEGVVVLHGGREYFVDFGHRDLRVKCCRVNRTKTKTRIR